MAGKFFLPEIWQQSSFFLQPFWFATKDFEHLKSRHMYVYKKSWHRYVLVTHNKASAGPRSASARDAPNTTTRALRVSRAPCRARLCGPTSSFRRTEPNPTQRPIIILLSCLAGDDEVERQNAEGWTKTRSRRHVFHMPLSLSFFPAAPAAPSAGTLLSGLCRL